MIYRCRGLRFEVARAMENAQFKELRAFGN
jgi:hypothetical protein